MFFKKLSTLLEPLAGLVMNLSADKDGIITISLLPKPKDVKDEAVSIIKPLTMRGTAEDLDANFFETIEKPIKKATGLYTDLSEFEKSVEEAEKSSKKAEKEKKTEKEEKDKKAKAVIENDKKAGELIKEIKTAIEAKEKPDALITKLNKFIEGKPVSEKVAATLNEQLDDLKKLKAQPELFGG